MLIQFETLIAVDRILRPTPVKQYLELILGQAHLTSAQPIMLGSWANPKSMNMDGFWTSPSASFSSFFNIQGQDPWLDLTMYNSEFNSTFKLNFRIQPILRHCRTASNITFKKKTYQFNTTMKRVQQEELLFTLI